MYSELPTVYQNNKQKAHKTHICCECLGTIEVGEIYHVHSGLWDHEWSRFKVCADCEELKNEVDKDIPFSDEKTPFEGLVDSVWSTGNKEYDKYFMRFVSICEKRKSKYLKHLYNTEQYKELYADKMENRNASIQSCITG